VIAKGLKPSGLYNLGVNLHQVRRFQHADGDSISEDNDINFNTSSFPKQVISMPYRIQFRAEGGWVHVQHTGELTIEEAYAARYEMRDMMVTRNCRRVLVHIAQAEPVLSTDEEDLYLRGHRNLLPLGVRIALVVNDRFMADKDAVEKHTLASGVLQRLFTSEYLALEWLLDSPS